MTMKDVIREHHGLLSDWRLQQCLKTLSHALERVISLLKSGYTYSSIMVPELTTEHVAYPAPHRCLVAFSLGCVYNGSEDLPFIFHHLLIQPVEEKTPWEQNAV